MAVACVIQQAHGQGDSGTKQPRFAIVKAVYGDLEANRVVDVTRRVRPKAGPEGVTVAADAKEFADPAQGSRMRLRIEYTVAGIVLGSGVRRGDSDHAASIQTRTL